ncbi:MAG: hypothetical protein ACTSWX_08835, partial [Promethearchaeota archaeon]
LDKMNRYSLDPIKTLFFGVCTTGIIFNLLDPESIEEFKSSFGVLSFRPSSNLNIWLIIMISITSFYLLYYVVLIYLRTPKYMKTKVQVISYGSFLTGFFTLIFFMIGISKSIPGLEIMPLSIGTLVTSISFIKSPEIIKVVLKSGEISKIKYIEKLLPICANCKKIRDSEGNWHQLEDYLLENSEIRFSHSFCPECEKKILSEIDKNIN